MRLQESGEMYLETIYVLTQQSPYVRSIDVCEHMGYILLGCCWRKRIYCCWTNRRIIWI